MDMFDPKNRRPREFFTWLGQYDWLDVIPVPDNQYLSKPTLPPKILQQPLGRWFIELTCDENLLSADYYTFYVWSKFLAKGPKRFRPTMEQCLVMEQMEINIPVTDYRQAYDVVAIDFPKEYIEYVSKKFNHMCPLGMLSSTFKNGGIVLLSFDRRTEMGDYVKLISPRADTIEAEIVSRAKMRGLEGMTNESEWKMSEQIERLTLNLNLLLCHFPTKLTLEDPKREKELTKQLSVPNRKARETAQREFEQESKIISFTQQIRLFDTHQTPNPQGGSHASPTPHWRKGHWRRQRHGPGLQEIKTVFIRPVLVNDQRFLGNIKDTQTIYKG